MDWGILMKNEKISMTWDLKAMYEGFECKEFKSDMDILDEVIEKLNSWGNNNLQNTEDAGRKLEEYMRLNETYSVVYDKLSCFTSLVSAADVNDIKAQRIMLSLDRKGIATKNVQVAFAKWLGQVEEIDSIIEGSSYLKEYEFIIKEMKDKNAHMLSEDVEVALSKMVLTGSSSWEKLRNSLTANLKVSMIINGKEEVLSLNKVRNFLLSPNADLRKSASEAEREGYATIEEGVAAALNGIKGEVITVSEMKDYESPLQRTLIEARMDEETLNSMMHAIKESLNDFQKYFRKKAKFLGYEDKLPYYDLMAPIGKIDKEYTYEEARDFIVKHFYSFSDVMGKMGEEAFEGWIDSEPREGKRGGGGCLNLHSINQSRIVCSYDDSFENVCMLAHELGHAYHGLILGDEKLINTRYPMPLAETASIFSENIVRNAALRNASDEEALHILSTELLNCASTIVDIYARFLFEKEIFERRKNGDLSVDEIKEIMIWAEKEAYGEAIDETTLDPYAWIHKPHYYFPDRNFYNFPYSFGLLFAKGLYSQYLKEGDAFVEKYNQILSLTGKSNVYDVGRFAGIDVHDINFWRNSLDIIRKDIEKFCEL